MARSTLARHRTFANVHQFARTSAEGGGGGTGGAGGGSNTGGSGTDTGGSGGGGGGGGGTDGPQVGPNGYPENTPVAQMSVEHQAAYWKHYARHHEARADARSDYDQQKADAEKWRQAQLQNLPPDQRAIEEAKEAGRREAAAQAATATVGAVLRVALEARGKEGDELNLLVTGANPAAFLTDGQVDAAKVSTYVATLTGGSGGGGADGGGGNGAGGQNGGGTGGGSIGQGERQQAPSKGVGAGKALFADRHPKAAAAANANA